MIPTPVQATDRAPSILTTPGYSTDDNIAVRSTRLLERLSGLCERCRPRSLGECRACVCRTAKDIVTTMKTSRYALGVVDLDTGAIERRDPSTSFRICAARAKARKALVNNEASPANTGRQVRRDEDKTNG